MKLYNKARGMFAIGLAVVSFSTGITHAAYWYDLGAPGYAPATGNKVYGPSSGIQIDISGTTRGFLNPAGSSWTGGTRDGWYDATDVAGYVGIQSNWTVDVDLIETRYAPLTDAQAPRFEPRLGDSFEIIRAGNIRWVTSAPDANKVDDWVLDPTGGPHTIKLNTTDAPLSSSNWFWKPRQQGNSLYLDVTTDLRNKLGLMAHDPVAPEQPVPQRGQLLVSGGSGGYHSSILDLSLLDAHSGSVDLTGDILTAPQNTPVDVLIELGGSSRIEDVAHYVDDYFGSSDFVAYVDGDVPFDSAVASYPGQWSMMIRFASLPGTPGTGRPIRFTWDLAADQEDDGDGANIQRIVVVPEPHALAAVLVFVAYLASRRFGWRGF